MQSSSKKWGIKRERPRVDCENLIEIVNQLQTKLAASGNTLDISLPQIVVVGCQSAGKSSVLENIVGKEFLPRGCGVVTRRPTVVQLEESKEEYAVFSHNPRKIFTDFEEVKQEITNETLKDPGPDGFSCNPICLKIYSPKVLQLTLVDLPGLIRVTVKSQSEDSIKEVRKMVLKYICQPNSLILAVSPANMDLANSDALEIAKTADPKRTRTIGVLTKLDLMDEGTDAREILENKKLPLKRGYIGVRNRSQKEIADGVDIDFCLQREKDYFACHPAYRHIADKMGTPYLRKTLNKMLYEHIRESLPSVRQELSLKLSTLQKKLRDFNAHYGRNSKEPFGVHFYLTKLLESFIERFHVQIFGYSEKIKIDKLSAGAVINYTLYRNIYSKLILPEIPDKSKLLITIASLHGIRNTLSLPSLALETVMHHLLPHYIVPLNGMVDNIANILQSCVDEITEEMACYPILRNEVIYLIKKTVDESALNTKETLEKHLQAEMYFVNAYHKDFAFPEFKKEEAAFPMRLWDTKFKKKEEIVSPWNLWQTDPPFVDSSENADDFECDGKEAIEILSSNEHAKKNADMLSHILEKYLDVQQKHIGDTAIKYILFFLVKNVMDFVKTGLVPTLFDCQNSDSIFEECEKDFNMIWETQASCDCLEEALIAVQTF